MQQMRIRAAFIRGGTSKGLFFHADELPADQHARDRILLAALGSPDSYGRQLDGLGGGISSLSKAVMIEKSSRDDADVNFTFAQVSVGSPVVDYAGTCGNLSSAVGPFAVDEGLVGAAGGEALVRVFNTNTSKVFHSRFAVTDGNAVVSGNQSIPGLSQSGAPVALEFLNPGGAMTGALLPSGNAIDELMMPDGGTIRASMIDATNPIVFVAAGEVGISATETPGELETNTALLARLETIRLTAGQLMGLSNGRGEIPDAVPKIAIVAPSTPSCDLQGETIPAEAAHLTARAVSMGRVHRALPLTLAMCLATACRIEGTVPNLVIGEGSGPSGEENVAMANPSGVIVAGADVVRDGHGWHAKVCRVIRTQRRLMDGDVLINMDQL